MSVFARNLLFAALCLSVVQGIGCRSRGLSPLANPWPFRRDSSDEVPGVRAPAERIATLRKMRQKAGWAKPEEQQRLSTELAAAYEGEEDPLIRVEIVRAIGRCSTPAAASVLRSALDDSDAGVRQVACKAWGRRGGPEAAAELTRILSSDVDKDVRLTAAVALGETGDPNAVAALGEVLAERDPAMQYVAVKSLREVTGEDLGNDVSRWREYVQREAPSSSDPASLAERELPRF
jgi:HEAT repeat protein